MLCVLLLLLLRHNFLILKILFSCPPVKVGYALKIDKNASPVVDMHQHFLYGSIHWLFCYEQDEFGKNVIFFASLAILPIIFPEALLRCLSTCKEA